MPAAAAGGTAVLPAGHASVGTGDGQSLHSVAGVRVWVHRPDTPVEEVRSWRMSECPATGTGSDTASGCAVGVPAASDDGTGRTGFADAVGPVVDAVVAGEGERAAPGIRVAVAFAGDVRAADSGEGIAEDAQTAAVGDVRIYVSGGKGVLPVVTTTTNRSTPHVPASCDDHEPTPGL